MFLLKELGILAAGIFVGFTFATMLLYPQIQKRYAMGQNSGHQSGAFRVISFLKDSFPQEDSDPAQLPLSSLHVKDATIEIIERNGVRTLRVR